MIQKENNVTCIYEIICVKYVILQVDVLKRINCGKLWWFSVDSVCWRQAVNKMTTFRPVSVFVSIAKWPLCQ